ncbi:UPF0481 protein [Quillaja saponaria]|uniref:UPF0481 protein n=1 Tax=Quillaja saponaria TaxID=32244 RepID=A0AAD7LQ35_QUISA|nr:UPF0481 protein [Quillaja saponaria]
MKSDRPFGKFKDYIVENGIRNCHADISMPDDKEFTDMIALDAVFIMEFFLSAKENPEGGNDCKHKNTNTVKHLTELLRCFYIPLDLSPNQLDNYGVSYSATKLYDSGISFKAVQERYLLDVNFTKNSYICWLFSLLTRKKIAKARLELPKLIIEDGIECKLRNLIALEQCHYPEQFFICDYVSLIEGLIETQEDVDFLLGEKVIVNGLGSNRAVAELVNSLCREILMTSSCYEKQLIKGLNEHYKDPFNLTMGTLRSVYLKDMWRATSTIVGLAVLAFTFVNFF